MEITMDHARDINKSMEIILDKNTPEDIKARYYFNLQELKQNLVDLEGWEELVYFKKLEDWNECHLPFIWQGDLVICKAE